MTGAEIARESRARQGLPPTVEDDATLDALARLIVAENADRSAPTDTDTPTAADTPDAA